jgi:hydrogenase maturation protease
MAKKTLVIGYGNAYCRDDGVALHILNRLRSTRGVPELQPDEDGLDGLGHTMDSVMLHQLVPEIAPVIAGYDLVVFIDAHMGAIPDEVRTIRVEEARRLHAVTHHMSPQMILSLAKESRGNAPSAYLVSVKGDDFDFGVGLSQGCRRRAERALEEIMTLIDESAHA